MRHQELLTQWEEFCLDRARGLRWQAQTQAPDTWEAMQASFTRDGILRVWNGGSEKTIFSMPQANFAFRAWHDSVHLAHGLDFSLGGEERVCERQIAEVYRFISDLTMRKGFAKILEIEIIGQTSEFLRSGRFVDDQREFMEVRL